MDFAERTLSGLDYLATVTALLRRVRIEHPTAGVWEAADFQWWWRKLRATDDCGQLFWFDTSGDPVAAAVATDWGGRLGLDVITLPSVADETVRSVWQRGLRAADNAPPTPVEVMLDDDDALMVSLVTAAGFVAEPGQGAAAWMQAHSAPTISPLPEGYSLASRADMGAATHHFADRTGPHVADRLEQTSLYRPDLDLVVLDTDGEPAAYGLFWHDPTTKVGFVEPMGTNEPHRRRGLARHLLTSGIHRLAESGASRIKINYETGNPASRSLYLDVGFIPAMTTSLYVRTPLVSPTEFTLRTL